MINSTRVCHFDLPLDFQIWAPCCIVGINLSQSLRNISVCKRGEDCKSECFWCQTSFFGRKRRGVNERDPTIKAGKWLRRWMAEKETPLPEPNGARTLRAAADLCVRQNSLIYVQSPLLLRLELLFRDEQLVPHASTWRRNRFAGPVLWLGVKVFSFSPRERLDIFFYFTGAWPPWKKYSHIFLPRCLISVGEI